MARKTNSKYKKQDLIKMIVDWTCEGIPQAQIKTNIMQLGYEISYFYTLHREAKPLIKSALQHIVENKLEETIAEMEEQYKLALEDGDRRLANDIRKEINKISGLHQQKLDVTTNGDSINNISIIKIIEIQKDNED
jgi:hypothetical protein